MEHAGKILYNAPAMLLEELATQNSISAAPRHRTRPRTWFMIS
jgi:hypothetical protein